MERSQFDAANLYMKTVNWQGGWGRHLRPALRPQLRQLLRLGTSTLTAAEADNCDGKSLVSHTVTALTHKRRGGARKSERKPLAVSC